MWMEHTSDDAKPPVRRPQKPMEGKRPSDRHKQKEEPTVEQLLKEKHLRVRLGFAIW